MPLIPIDPDRFYHGVFPEIDTGAEDQISPQSLKAYEDAAGRAVAWVYFSHNWFNGYGFPLPTVQWITATHRLPFIRLMMRSDDEKVPDDGRPHPDPVFNLAAINGGTFDHALHAWGQKARDCGSPLIVEWGTEMNGYWFRWNGLHNGRADGPRRFRDAFRRIVKIIREDAGARNVTWVFHINDTDDRDPASAGFAWNRMENYYPGNDVIDWLGLSVYGAQEPKRSEPCEPCEPQMTAMYRRLAALAPSKPIFLLEFGATAGHPQAGSNEQCKPEKWADAALKAILADNRYPRLRGFSWWNESWPNDHAPRTEMRVQMIPELREVFRHHLVNNSKIIDHPLP
jgi:hypothetical protein